MTVDKLLAYLRAAPLQAEVYLGTPFTTRQPISHFSIVETRLTADDDDDGEPVLYVELG